MPFSSIFLSNSGVKCKPAVGAAAEPYSLAYTVWYISLFSSFSWIYGGSGMVPNFSKISIKIPL